MSDEQALARREAERRVIDVAIEWRKSRVNPIGMDFDLFRALAALDQHNPSTKAQEREG